jgi:hypothetical protein
VLVIPEQLALSRAHEAFETDGSLKDPKRAASVTRVAASLVRIVARLS